MNTCKIPQLYGIEAQTDLISVFRFFSPRPPAIHNSYAPQRSQITIFATFVSFRMKMSNMDEKYRKLTAAEIDQMESNGCFCTDWTMVEVAKEGFDSRFVRQSRLAGHVRIGRNTMQPSGIYNASLTDTVVGDNSLIYNTGCGITNYKIGNGVRIENCDAIICDGSGNFGNGIEVKVINEGGGREVVIFNGLTAQFAYMMAMYRENGTLTEKLRTIALAECDRIAKDSGRISNGAKLTCCGKLLNVNVGEAAIIDGSSKLHNGTVNSSAMSPAYVGAGVKAYDFIFAEGSRVDNGAILERCFVGENCRVDHYFSATDTLLFANSDVANGEACSVFAGPFTVSHHRSSLLIAGYFSFFNAGSGSNQSNHLFKTGAVHQGIHERGCKFGSNAYVMLPAREGAFSVVMGRHTSHHDTKDLPYSYLVEEEGKTFVIPGANLRSFGTSRDMAKWPARDKRKIKRDIINFEQYNPYVGEKLLAAMEICEKLLDKPGHDIHTFNRIRIKTPLLKRGHESYRLALDALIGSLLSQETEAAAVPCPHWVDMAGMFAPAEETAKLLNGIKTGILADIGAINSAFERINKSYSANAKAWALWALSHRLGHNPTQEEIANAVATGAETADTLASMMNEDSLKDDSQTMRTGYGIDARDRETVDADFEAVRKEQRQ